MDLEKFKKVRNSKKKENRKFLAKLKKGNPRKLDADFHQMHEEVFAETNCLECANCCKTTSPIFRDKDIDNLAQHLRMKPGELINQHLQLDDEGVYVLKSSPCPFLLPDNRCSVYAHRPKACREYPHTNRKRMVNILDLTHKNTLVCPAVLEIVERLKAI